MIWKEGSITSYLLLYLATIVILGVNIVLSFVPLDGFNVAIEVSLAAATALIIILSYMHVAYRSPMTRLFAMGGFLWLGILILLMLSDYLTRVWLFLAPS